MIIDRDVLLPNWPGLAGRDIAVARAENLSTEPVRRVFAWWQAHAGMTPPRRADFDIIEFAPIAGHLYLIDQVAEGFELRLAGEEFIRLFDLKKGWLWRNDAEDPVMRDSAKFLTFTSGLRRPMRTIGRLLLSDRQWVQLEALVCPLSCEDGSVRQLLGCTAALDAA